MKHFKPCIAPLFFFFIVALFLSSCVSVKQYRDLEDRLSEAEASQFTVSDDDNDGVLNELDKEPNTPRGAPVSTRGIQLDSDKDGFPDHRDREPFSPPNYPVDDKGVAIRSDEELGWDTKPKEEETDLPKGEDGQSGEGELEEFFHQVQRGETLFSIAQKYDVEVDEIKAWNQLSSNEPINPGQNLIIYLLPGTEIPEEPEEIEPVVPKIPATHVVQKGDTLYSISRQYSVSVDEIKRLNNIGTSTIYPGQELRLK